MGIVNEEITHPEFEGVTLEVVERQPGEMVEAWRIAEFQVSLRGERFTPKELRHLGHWLVQEGKRLGKSYTSKGAPRATKPTA